MIENNEYSSPVKLDDNSKNYFIIPSDIILNHDMTEKRASVFSFFSAYRGLSCGLFFSINSIVKWMGKMPNRTANGINSKIIQVIECLKDEGYLTLYEELNNSSCIEAVFNLSKISQECEQYRFAVVYIDELKKIINYKAPNSKDSFINNDVLLLVFAYLRMIITRRRNKMSPEETNVDNKHSHKHDVEVRRLRIPEAHDCYYYQVADKLGLSARTVSRVVAVLNELGLIYSEALPRIHYDGKWRTDHTVFCNTYKREGSYLLASGRDYYLTEVENKKKILQSNKQNKI